MRWVPLNAIHMHLIYLDESGNTGNNLNDPQQPVFVLCALIVPEAIWLPLERDLLQMLAEHLPLRTEHDEVHAADLRTGRGCFAKMTVLDRIRFRDEWLRIAVKHRLRVVYRAIEKKRYRQWLSSTFGPGIVINPHVAAFPLLATVVNEFLRGQPGDPLGLFISDDNREIVPDVEKSIRVLRGIEGKLRLGQIVEKGFFIDSRQCLPLQLCDLIALSLRKREEKALGHPAKSFDEKAFPIIESLVHRGNEATLDVLSWLADRQKK